MPLSFIFLIFIIRLSEESLKSVKADEPNIVESGDISTIFFLNLFKFESNFKSNFCQFKITK